MKIAVYGAGGVGGYFGGLLARAGHEVVFLARGAHLEAIRDQGLRIRSVNGDFDLPDARAVAAPEEAGLAEYVVVAVKHYHLEEISHRLGPMLSPETTIVPLLNGVDAPEILARAVGQKRVVGGFCSLVSMIAAPGEIHQPSRLRRVEIGELDRRRTRRVERLVQAWQACGVEAVHSEDIRAAMWKKFVFISSFGGITSLAQATAGELRETPETRALFLEAMREAARVGRAQGVDLPDGAAEHGLSLADGFEPAMTSSMQRDVASGNRFELEAFSGLIVRMGAAAGVPTPVHAAIYALLRPALERAGR